MPKGPRRTQIIVLYRRLEALIGKTQVQLSRLAKKSAAEDWFRQFASVEEALARPELPASIAERQRAKLGQAVSTGARPTPCHQRSSGSSSGGSSGSSSSGGSCGSSSDGSNGGSSGSSGSGQESGDPSVAGPGGDALASNCLTFHALHVVVVACNFLTVFALLLAWLPRFAIAAMQS